MKSNEKEKVKRERQEQELTGKELAKRIHVENLRSI